jgi:hypothetical protein
MVGPLLRVIRRGGPGGPEREIRLPLRRSK